MNKHEAMFNYIKQYVPLYLTFNTTIEQPEQTSIETVDSDAMIKQYSSGDQLKQYIFAVVQVKQYDSGITDSPINAKEIQDVQAFMDWIDEQQKNKNFPDFGEMCEVQSIVNLQNMPILAGINSQNEAKYIFQCAVNYIERRN